MFARSVKGRGSSSSLREQNGGRLLSQVQKDIDGQVSQQDPAVVPHPAHLREWTALTKIETEV